MTGMKKAITLIITMLVMTLVLPVSTQAKTVTTPAAQLPVKSNVAQITVKINSNNGKTRSYTVFGQHKNPWKKTAYLDMHGCAVSSLTCVLSAYSKKYGKYTPVQVKNNLEKKALGTAAWKKNYSKPVLRQMPISVYGISKVLNYAGIKTKYVRTFTNKQAEKQIQKHLQTGNAVVIETNNRTQVNGRFSNKTTGRWALGKHTMVLLGLTDDGRVIVADSAQRTWSKKKQRIKYTTVKEIVKYLIPCKSSARTFYFSSTAASGGYVLVNPQN